MKSIFNYTLLSVLFVISACSTVPKIHIEAGLDDALNRIGSTAGMIQYSSEVIIKTTEVESKASFRLFFSTDKYKEAFSQSFNGKARFWNGKEYTSWFTFNNEVIGKSAREGNLTLPTTSFTIILQSIQSSTASDITAEVIAKGFTKIYILTPTKAQCWISAKSGGSGQWEDSILTPRYYLVKEGIDTLQIVPLSKDTTTTDTYNLSYSSLEQAIRKYSRIYEK